ncbi:MAG TPA: hypothetical protein VE733_24490 [Streptosporangiaceae bacterium]|jgi:hypothetical protein|nr:hypothetical protein [Streptosporangiaceae bacterium]
MRATLGAEVVTMTRQHRPGDGGRYDVVIAGGGTTGLADLTANVLADAASADESVSQSESHR